jgi:hypothetical protein
MFVAVGLVLATAAFLVGIMAAVAVALSRRGERQGQHRY